MGIHTRRMTVEHNRALKTGVNMTSRHDSLICGPHKVRDLGESSEYRSNIATAGNSSSLPLFKGTSMFQLRVPYSGGHALTYSSPHVRESVWSKPGLMSGRKPLGARHSLSSFVEFAGARLTKSHSATAVSGSKEV